jgi:hypothetical protein
MLTDSRALMHLSVCGGGIIQSASELGISRRAQTLLKDALECFDADGLRVSYREWKPLHTELQRLEASVEYSQQMSKANAAALVYHECARQVDRTQMVRTRYGERERREEGREGEGWWGIMNVRNEVRECRSRTHLWLYAMRVRAHDQVFMLFRAYPRAWEAASGM